MRHTKFKATCLVVLVFTGLLAMADEPRERMVAVGPGEFLSVIPADENAEAIVIPAFLLDIQPVTNQDFLDFATEHPEWLRGNAVRLFVDESYLSHWKTKTEFGLDVAVEQPVVHVSWFAATAYCEARGARLPRWYEWEYVAAADETRSDARDDPSWRQQILNWYAIPGSQRLSVVGQRTANLYGVHDLHGLVWEWVDDFNALLVSADNREQGGADKTEFCGAGAISMERKEDYAVLMRVAMLSSLQAAYTTRNLGFRCADDFTEIVQ